MSRTQVRLDADVVDLVQAHNEDGLSLSGATNRLLRGLAATAPAEPPRAPAAPSPARIGADRPGAPLRRPQGPLPGARRARRPAVLPEGGRVMRLP